MREATMRKNGRIALKFDYNRDLVLQVKELRNPRWNQEQKFWEVDADNVTGNFLVAKGFDCDAAIWTLYEWKKA
jgi:hypothetical protein